MRVSYLLQTAAELWCMKKSLEETSSTFTLRQLRRKESNANHHPNATKIFKTTKVAETSKRLYHEARICQHTRLEWLTIEACALITLHAIVVVAVVVERPGIRVIARTTEVLDPHLICNLKCPIAMWAFTTGIFRAVVVTTLQELLCDLA